MSTLKKFIFFLLLIAAAFSAQVAAHDSRPAYLQIDETAPGDYTLLWRTPVMSGRLLPVALGLPESTQMLGEPVTQRLHDSLLEHLRIRVQPGLAGQRIDFSGLQATITDVLVRVQYLDGSRATVLVHANRPWVEIPAPQSAIAVASSYLRHGVEHILLGFDHLLFVFALILIVRNRRTLIWTITAFTLAHSITLASSSLGLVRLSASPVEATIALSIVLLAVEILRARRGQRSATARRPWLVAFLFGLLHGFGFAGALNELGLPEGDIPLALFAFNLGVELGQLAFVAAMLGLMAVARRIHSIARLDRYALRACAYGIGCLAAFWFCERAAQIF